MSSIAELLAHSGIPTKSEAAAERLADGTRVVYLHAGQLFVSQEPTQATTILGSCVAICLWDPTIRVGGLNHFMLPNDIGTSCASPRYATFATATLLDNLVGLGCDRRRLQAKIFGGARVLSAFQRAGHDLGTQNIEVARLRLAEQRIPIVSEDVGGSHGRKLIFRTDNGMALVKKV